MREKLNDALNQLATAKVRNLRSHLFIFLISTFFLLSFQTIEEKKSSVALRQKGDVIALDLFLKDLNENLSSMRRELKEKYTLVQNLTENEDYETLLGEVRDLKDEIVHLENKWRDLSLTESKKEEEGYALWDQADTTLSELVMEYGSNDYLYVIPPELISMKINLYSAIPIPRESWNELLEIILAQNGIGITELNPYARKLYLMKKDLSSVEAILSSEADLEKIPAHQRIVYIFTPSPEQIKFVSHFFDRFRDPQRTFIYQVGYKVAIVSTKEEVQKLLTLYETVWAEESQKVTKVFPLTKLSPEQMEKILKSFFGTISKTGRVGMSRGVTDELSIIPLKEEGALILVGVKELVAKGEEIIKNTEEQMKDPCEMTVYWYTCRHSDPIDVADVLEKVYLTLICTSMEDKVEAMQLMQPEKEPQLKFTPKIYGPPGPTPVVNPPVAVAATAGSQKQESRTMNFIPYPKTGAIMMVVRRDTLDKLKELLKKIDVPKKMVQIDVLLFEKKLTNQNNFGLNLLRMGTPAKGVRETGLDYDSFAGDPTRGILEFFIRRPKTSGFPAFDIAYNFLMSQEDVRVNDSPSITTLNQVPAQISVVEEISVNNGAAPLETNTGITFENSFTRNQYGTTIVITPTIHEPSKVDGKPYISLETDVSFDTIQTDENDRPKVNRRHIENQVRVLDGETVILGGLRRKIGTERTEKIPFLGEIPGIAKFFGTSRLTDQQTEMFMFITPRVIPDEIDRANKMREQQLMKRAGDLPEFLARVNKAKDKSRRKIFENSFKLLFGRVNG